MKKVDLKNFEFTLRSTVNGRFKTVVMLADTEEVALAKLEKFYDMKNQFTIFSHNGWFRLKVDNSSNGVDQMRPYHRRTQRTAPIARH